MLRLVCISPHHHPHQLHFLAFFRVVRIVSLTFIHPFRSGLVVRNPNSSRFGKWMTLDFDQHNIIHSSSIVSYLLEKGRVTSREAQERNYHIFYQVDSVVLESIHLSPLLLLWLHWYVCLYVCLSVCMSICPLSRSFEVSIKHN